MIKEGVLSEVVRDYIEKEIPELIEREITVPLDIPIKRAVSIIGPRRAGKTYLMFQLMRKIDREKRLYINFEDYRLEGMNYRDFAKMIEIYYRIFPENKKRKVYFFFDEIQNVNEWERIVRYLLDSENCQIFITGSSSKLLSKEIATELRGRTITYEIFPFSFREFLKAKRFEVKEFLSGYERAKLFNLLEEYLRFGGYPEAVLFNEKEKILEEIWEVTVARDIIERWRIRNIRALKLLIKAIKESEYFSVYKFYKYLKSLGLRISKNTLYNYLEALNDALIVFPLHKYSPSYKDVEKSIPKIYLADVGLYLGSLNLSRRLENVVFLELRKNYREIYYYQTKNGKEIDFFIKEKKLLIEVAYELDEEHIKKVLRAMEELKLKKAFIITWSGEDEIIENNKRIYVLPLWKWLLRGHFF